MEAFRQNLNYARNTVKVLQTGIFYFLMDPNGL